MTKIFVPALALVLSTGVSYAQSSTDPTGSIDHKASHAAGGEGGTVGAMETFAYGLATSPEDVARQQIGMRTGAEGGSLLSGRSAVKVEYSPGSVGSTPGATQGR